MKRVTGRRAGVLIWTVLTLAATAVAAPADLGKRQRVKGVVIETEQDRFLVRDGQGVSTEVRLTPAAEIEEKKSNFLRQPRQFQTDDIVTGLNVILRGRFDPQGVFWADTVKFTQDDLRVAHIVDASLEPAYSQLSRLEETSGRLSGQVDELNEANRSLRSDLRRTTATAEEALEGSRSAHHRIDHAESRLHTVESRFEALADYELGESAVVYFEAGRATLRDGEKVKLDALVEALGEGIGMLVEVTGFASSDGSEALNRRLSQRRAESVIRYLAEEHRIPLRVFVNPHGFGELLPAADNTTAEGRRLNRRAEVRILINRGLHSPVQVTG